MHFDMTTWSPITVLMVTGGLIYMAMHAVGYCINTWKGNTKGAASDNSAIQVLTQMVTSHDNQLTGLAQNQIPPTAIPRIMEMLGQQMADNRTALANQQSEYARHTQQQSFNSHPPVRPPPAQVLPSYQQPIPQSARRVAMMDICPPGQPPRSSVVVGAFGPDTVPADQQG